MDPSSKTTRLRSRSLKERAEKCHLREHPSRKFRDIQVLAVRRCPFYIQLVASFSWWIPILECKMFKSKDHWCKSRTSRNSRVHLMTLHTSYHVFPPHWSPSPIACGKDKRQALQHGKIDPSAVVSMSEIHSPSASTQQHIEQRRCKERCGRSSSLTLPNHGLKGPNEKVNGIQPWFVVVASSPQKVKVRQGFKTTLCTKFPWVTFFLTRCNGCNQIS